MKRVPLVCKWCDHEPVELLKDWLYKDLLFYFCQHSNAWIVCWVQRSEARYNLTAMHCNNVIMGMMASQITNFTIIYSAVYSGGNLKNIKAPRHWRGIHRSSVNSPHKWRITRKMFSFHDVIIWMTGILVISFKRKLTLLVCETKHI